VAASASFVRSTERARGLALRVASCFAEDGAIALPELVEVPRSHTPRVTAMQNPRSPRRVWGSGAGRPARRLHGLG
jgi:hypothetical protein